MFRYINNFVVSTISEGNTFGVKARLRSYIQFPYRIIEHSWHKCVYRSRGKHHLSITGTKKKKRNGTGALVNPSSNHINVSEIHVNPCTRGWPQVFYDYYLHAIFELQTRKMCQIKESIRIHGKSHTKILVWIKNLNWEIRSLTCSKYRQGCHWAGHSLKLGNDWIYFLAGNVEDFKNGLKWKIVEFEVHLILNC